MKKIVKKKVKILLNNIKKSQKKWFKMKNRFINMIL